MIIFMIARWTNCYSHRLSSNVNAKKGTLKAPFLFIPFSTDILNVLLKITCGGRADDLKIVGKGP